MPRQKLIQRTDGMYRCKYHGIEFYGRTQEIAFAKRQEYIDAENAGYYHNTDEMTFHAYATRWIELYRADCGQAQRNQYMNFINYTAKELESINKPVMKDILSSDIQYVYNTLKDRSPSYISKFMTTIKGIFTAAQADGAILHNPTAALRRPKVRKTEGHRALEAWERELVTTTYEGHDFGLCAMVMLYAGLRRGEALYLNIDRDIDFRRRTITVRQAVSFVNGNQPVITDGKTEAAQRVIPLNDILADALKGHHGLLCPKEDGELMTETAFTCKYNSYLNYLEKIVNGCPKRWYGKTREHKEMLKAGIPLPPWKEINIRCHDFRVDFCTQAYEAGVPVKTLQKWMGHADATMIMNVYAKITEEKEMADALSMNAYINATRKQPDKVIPMNRKVVNL